MKFIENNRSKLTIPLTPYLGPSGLYSIRPVGVYKHTRNVTYSGGVVPS